MHVLASDPIPCDIPLKINSTAGCFYSINPENETHQTKYRSTHMMVIGQGSVFINKVTDVIIIQYVC